MELANTASSSSMRMAQDSMTGVWIAASTMILMLVLFSIRLGTSNKSRCGLSRRFGNFVSDSMSLLSNKDSILERDQVKDSVADYENLFDDDEGAVLVAAGSEKSSQRKEERVKTREREYETMVSTFYDLVTDFYEWGWGQSFHFAPRYKDETFMESIKRCEYYLALRSGMDRQTKALDVGCGVGGPMRNLQSFTGADITGVTICEYQARVGNKYCQQSSSGQHDKCRIRQGDFQKLPEIFEEGQFDVAYAIEATCHSPDRIKCFSGVNHCLKKGGIFCGYEWVVLPERGFDTTNKEHVRIKEGIEAGNGIPNLTSGADVLKALEEAGFEILEAFDANQNAHSDKEIPWYDTLNGSLTLSGFRMTRFGRMCTHAIVSTLEFLRIAPKGTVRVSSFLNATANDLVDGGKNEIFTPSFFFLARKK